MHLRSLPLFCPNPDERHAMELQHAHLLSTLTEHFELAWVTESETAERTLSDHSVRLVVAVASGLLTWAELLPLEQFVQRGGTLIAAGNYAASSDADDMHVLFRRLGLPWRTLPATRREEYIATPACASLPGAPQCYSVKAVTLTNVAPEARLYVPEGSAVATEGGSADSADAVQGAGGSGGSGCDTAAGDGVVTPAALQRVGEGAFAFLGDVLSEAATSFVLCALCSAHAQ